MQNTGRWFGTVPGCVQHTEEACCSVLRGHAVQAASVAYYIVELAANTAQSLQVLLDLYIDLPNR